MNVIKVNSGSNLPINLHNWKVTIAHNCTAYLTDNQFFVGDFEEAEIKCKGQPPSHEW